MKQSILLIVFSISFFGIGYLVGAEAKSQQQSASPYTAIAAELSDWDLIQLAIIKTESGFNPLAVGDTGDIGLYQITEIYVEEVNRILGEPIYTHTDAFCPEKSKKMFDIYQDYYNPKKNINKAITLHNPNGDAFGYSVKVLKNMAELKKYERFRKMVIGKIQE